MVLQDLTYLKN